MKHDPIDTFIEQMGMMTQQDGFPRIAGQILGYLIVEGEARSLGEITGALKISKGSASTNCRLLAERGAIERVGAIGSRQDSYRAVENPTENTLAGMAERFRQRAGVIEEAAAQFPDNRGDARERVCGLATFFRNSAQFLDEWTKRAKAIKAETE